MPLSWTWLLLARLYLFITAEVHADIRLPGVLFTNQLPAPLASVAACDAATEFYDESVLGCTQCSAGYRADDQLLVPDTSSSEDSAMITACTCDQGAIWTSRSQSSCDSTWPAPCSLEVCTSCPSDQVASQDSSRCMSCGNSTLGIDALTVECKCPINAILREKSETGAHLAEKECVKCSDGTIADSSSSECRPCPDPAMKVVDSIDGAVCACPVEYQLITSEIMTVQKCVLQGRVNALRTKVDMSSAGKITYSAFLVEETGSSNSVVSLSSATMGDMFLLAATDCYFYQNEHHNAACQALGNLCVLQHFDPTVPSCSIFDLIQRNGRVATVNGVNGWYDTLPFLNYHSASTSVLQDTSIGMKMSFDEVSQSGTHDHLDFVLASYHANGTLIGFRALTNELAFCYPGSWTSKGNPPAWMRFGVSTWSEYSCNLTALQTSALVLHELFLIDHSKSDGEAGRFIPVPVRNLNYYDENGVFVNRNIQSNDDTDDFLSHRFFLFDAQSGIPSSESTPKVIRYAQYIRMDVKAQSSGAQLIYVPVLSIAYVDTFTPRLVPVNFHAVYASDTTSFWSSAVTLFVVLCIVAGCRVLLQTFNWNRRSNRNNSTDNTMSHSIAQLVVCGISSFALVCFIVLFMLCNYFFLFFKFRPSATVLLPELKVDALADTLDEYAPFRVLLVIAFTCQLGSVIHHIYRQTQIQLFFIDWEKPRATIMDIDSAKPTQAPVSIWRTILVTNEWNELQTARKTSLRFTLVVILFLLYGLDLQSLALPIPLAQMSYAPESTAAVSTRSTDLQLNLCLRFANVSCWWLLVCLAQRLWKWLIYERYFDEPREQLFIDLCTMAKVSCFFLDEQYHGYYLHCRSPHPFADGSMEELVAQLKQEEAGLTAGRHLDSTLPDCQAFEIFVTRKWKRKFQSLFVAVRGENASDTRGSYGGRKMQRSFSPKRGGPPTLPLHSTDMKRLGAVSTTDAMVYNAGQLRDFLQAFIENHNDKFRWRIYRAHTWLTRFLDLPPDMSISRQSLFIPDIDNRFAKAALLLGIENDLMMLDLLCFSCFDLWVGNHAVSALATYVLHNALLLSRAHFGRRNIVKSTLVDARFLV